ncbi:DUF6455 family protein [Ferrovibrio sp.]|uniref:DUF6455 family protein n=1 Tax=Ferrovibrio sp. TaxID=1917215 RepID=UPI003D0E41B6
MSILSRLFKTAPAQHNVAPQHSADSTHRHPHTAATPEAAATTAKLPFWRMARWLGTPVGEPDDHHKDAQRDAMLQVCKGCAQHEPCQRWLEQKHPVGFPIFCPNAPDLLDRRDEAARQRASRERPRSGS